MPIAAFVVLFILIDKLTNGQIVVLINDVGSGNALAHVKPRLNVKVKRKKQRPDDAVRFKNLII